MIVVLGRPAVHRPEPDGDLAPAGLAWAIASTLAGAGAAVELAGAIGDDREGDQLVVALGRAGVGHAALLRDPAASTPSLGPATFVPSASLRRSPRLDAEDVELALRYLADCRVLVVADTLAPEALASALRAAEYHAAAAIVIAPGEQVDPGMLGERVTLLERPGPEPATPASTDVDDAIGDDDAAFARLVAGYARRLADGQEPGRAFAAALDDGAWEPAAE